MKKFLFFVPPLLFVVFYCGSSVLMPALQQGSNGFQNGYDIGRATAPIACLFFILVAIATLFLFYKYTYKSVSQNERKKLIVIVIVFSMIFTCICLLCISSLVLITSNNHKENADTTIGTSAGTESTKSTKESYSEIKDLGLRKVKTKIGDDPSLGDKTKTKTVIIEYGSYLCSLCQQQFSYILPSLVKNYVATNKAIYVYKDYEQISIMHTEDETKPPTFPKIYTNIPLAAECVYHQYGSGKFFEFQNIVFNSINYNDSRSLRTFDTKDNMQKLADRISINDAKFKKCLEDETYRDEIGKDRIEGDEVKLEGTPTTIIGTLKPDGTVYGFILTGAYSYQSYSRVLDAVINDPNSLKKEVDDYNFQQESIKKMVNEQGKYTDKYIAATIYPRNQVNKEGGFSYNPKVKFYDNVKPGALIKGIVSTSYKSKDPFITLTSTVKDFGLDPNGASLENIVIDKKTENSAYDWVKVSYSNSRPEDFYGDYLDLEIKVPENAESKTYWFAIEHTASDAEYFYDNEYHWEPQVTKNEKGYSLFFITVGDKRSEQLLLDKKDEI